MANYRIKTSIQGVFTEMDLYLEAKHIALSYDGDQTYASTDILDLTDEIVFQWIGRGLSFQQWTITLLVAAQQPDGSFDQDKKWTAGGQIPQGGGSQLYKEIALASLTAAAAAGAAGKGSTGA
jgi:hypothetical protein